MKKFWRAISCLLLAFVLLLAPLAQVLAEYQPSPAGIQKAVGAVVDILKAKGFTATDVDKLYNVAQKIGGANIIIDSLFTAEVLNSPLHERLDSLGVNKESLQGFLATLRNEHDLNATLSAMKDELKTNWDNPEEAVSDYVPWIQAVYSQFATDFSDFNNVILTKFRDENGWKFTKDEILLFAANIRNNFRVAYSNGQLTVSIVDEAGLLKKVNDKLQEYDINPIEQDDIDALKSVIVGLNTKINNVLNVDDKAYLYEVLHDKLGIPTPSSGGGGVGGGGSVLPADNEIIVEVDPQKASTVSSKDGSVSLELPAGFASGLPAGVKVTVSVSPLSEKSLQRLLETISQQPADMEVLSQAFVFTATYETKGGTQQITQFAKPLRATFKVDAKVINNLKAKGIDPEKISLFKVLDDGTLEFKGGRYNPQTGTLTVDLYGFSKYIMAVYNKTFSDLANHWAKKDIEVLASKQIIKGVTDKEFAPEADITRAEFAALLVRLLNFKVEQTPALTFTDVKPGDWYYNAVAMAVQAGLVSGRDAKTFAPNDKVTRQEMAAMIGRALVKFGKAQTLTPAEVETLLSTYADKEAIAKWATDMSAVAIKQGIIRGRSVTTFVPAANAKRAEAAAMLKRLFDME